MVLSRDRHFLNVALDPHDRAELVVLLECAASSLVGQTSPDRVAYIRTLAALLELADRPAGEPAGGA